MKINIFCKPASKIDKAEWKDEVLHVKIKAKPVNGEANEALTKFLSEYFKIPASKITLLKGHTSKHKVVEITD